MNNYCIKQKISNEKGITLVSLAITIAVLAIILGVSLNIGTESLDSTRLKAFYMELETVQKRIDDIETTNETFIDSNNKVINIKENEEFKLTSEEKNILEDIIEESQINLEQIYPGLTVDQFRYFTSQELYTILDLTQIEQNIFIHFESRTVISQKGKKIGGKTYYILKNNIYYPTQDTDKNVGEITSLNYSQPPIAYGTGKYKVVISAGNTIGDLNTTGRLEYKKTNTKYWEISTNGEIVLELDVEYNVKYIDANNNSLEKKIKVVLDTENGNIPAVQEITE